MLKRSFNSRNGFSLIELLIVVAVIGVIAAIAVPNLMATRRSANEASAVSSIRVIFGAQATYRATQGNGYYADELADLGTSGIVDTLLGCPADPCAKSGYSFAVDKNDGVIGSYPPYWNVLASPTTPNGVMQTGTISLYSNEAGAVFYLPGGTPPTAGLSATVRAPTNGLPVGN